MREEVVERRRKRWLRRWLGMLERERLERSLGRGDVEGIVAMGPLVMQGHRELQWQVRWSRYSFAKVN